MFVTLYRVFAYLEGYRVLYNIESQSTKIRNRISLCGLREHQQYQPLRGTPAAEQDDLRGSCSCGAGETGRHGAPAAARADPHAQVCCLTERATTESVCSSVANFAGKPESAPPVRPNVGKPEICLMLIS